MLGRSVGDGVTRWLLAAALVLGGVADAEAAGAQPLRVYMAGDYMPLHGMEDGERVGFEADLARRLAERMGFSGVEFSSQRDTGLSSIDSVARGKVDVALNAVTPTAERARLVGFTRPYVQLEYWLVGRPDGITPHGAPDLRGVAIGVAKGPALDFARAKLRDARLTSARNVGHALELLQSGAVQAVLDEAPAFLGALEAGRVVLLKPVLGTSAVAMAVPRGSESKYDAALAALPLEETWRPWLEGLEAQRREARLFAPRAPEAAAHVTVRATKAYAGRAGEKAVGTLEAGELLPEIKERRGKRVRLDLREHELWVSAADVAGFPEAWFESSTIRPDPGSDEPAQCVDGPCGCLPPDHRSERFVVAIHPAAMKLLDGGALLEAAAERTRLARLRLATALVSRMCDDAGLLEHVQELQHTAECWRGCSQGAEVEGDGCCDCYDRENFEGSAEALELVLRVWSTLADDEAPVDDTAAICGCLEAGRDAFEEHARDAAAPWLRACNLAAGEREAE